MIPNININIGVDTVAALSEQTLQGHMCLMDDSIYNSQAQGSTGLITHCVAGQLITWVIYPVDLQTPITLKSIEFLPSEQATKAAQAKDKQSEKDAEYGEYPAQQQADHQAYIDTLRANYDEYLAAQDLPPLAPLDSEEEASSAPKATTELKTNQQKAAYVIKQIKENADPDANVWAGYVPSYLIPGQQYFYRVTVEIGKGKNALLFSEKASLQLAQPSKEQ